MASVTVAISPGLHLTMVFAVLAVVGAALFWGFSAGSDAQRKRRSATFGYAIGVLWLLYNLYYFLPSNFRWDTSLPLHVCDLLGLISAIALVWGSRTARALLYFCASILAVQAVITPTGNQDPAAARFWLYWLLHAGIVAASIYDLAINKFYPHGSDLGRAILVDVLYVAVIVPLDIVTGWNYGYLGNHKPDVVTAVDLFGPWPLRILLMLLAVICLQTLMYVPWALRERAQNRPLQGKL